MAKKAPGKHFRKGLTVAEFIQKFPDDATAEAWIVKRRWPNGVCCTSCGSLNVNTAAKRKGMPFRCREKGCGACFSPRTKTFMQSSKLGYRDWLFAIYRVATSLKGVASMKLHRDLGITQKSAWHMAHRIRKALSTSGCNLFEGPVEVDETYVGGKRRNMPNRVRKELTGRGPVGKTAVVGAKDRATKRVAAEVVRSTDKETLQGFVGKVAAEGAKVYTDDAKAYKTLPFNHDSVKHSLQQYVKGDVHTNGIESLWSLLKRGHKGVNHKLSPKHLDRYVQEFAGRHNLREEDTMEMMARIVGDAAGTQLSYRDLTAPNGLSSHARELGPPESGRKLEAGERVC